MTGPWPLPKQVIHRVWSCASWFNFLYPFISFSSSSSCIHLVTPFSFTCILPSTFSSITCFRRQFLHRIWPIHLAYLLSIAYSNIPFSLTLCKASSFLAWFVQMISSIHFQHHILKFSSILYVLCTDNWCSVNVVADRVYSHLFVTAEGTVGSIVQFGCFLLFPEQQLCITLRSTFKFCIPSVR